MVTDIEKWRKYLVIVHVQQASSWVIAQPIACELHRRW
jgi:hypothetical protein